jgi:flagellar protein FlaG
MDKIAISRLATMPQQAKSAKHDARVKAPGQSDAGAVAQVTSINRAVPASAAQNVGAQNLEFLQRVREMQKLADEAFVNEDLRLSITFDESVGRFIYRGLDRETGEVKREFPPEELLDTIVALRKIAGIAVDRKL